MQDNFTFREDQLPTGTVTFMFTDIEGSSRMWEADQQAARSALGMHDTLIIGGVQEAGGVIVKSRGEGDSHFAVFAHAGDALKAAVAIQRAVAAEFWPTEQAIRVRMALHTGEAELRMGDYYGRTVNRTARLRAIGHGGQILLSSTTAVLVQDLLPPDVTLLDLGEHLLKDLSRPEQVSQVAVKGLQIDFSPLKSLNLSIHKLPAQSTSFIGRDREVNEIVSLLDREQVRLVTLSGPGGTGKTRLSLEVGNELVGRFKNGVFFVPLAEATTPELVVSKTARELDVREGGNLPLLETLKGYLSDKQTLLLLDNFEQVIDAAHVVEALLAAAPELKILVTSQVLLNLRAEHNYPVPTLSLPRTDQPLSVDALNENEATSLFIERAAAANPRLVITDENAPVVVEICRRLDGLPLAIELAAARVRMLSLEALLARLSERWKLLAGGARDLPHRQQTLRNAIDWSYDLLGEDERKLLARLSIFVGGFTLESAEAVCAIEDDLDIFTAIEQLLDHSLINQRELPGGIVRFQMLEAIREYALERLLAYGELDTMRRQHATYFSQQMNTRGYSYYSPEAVGALDWTDIEHDNLRATLAASLESEEGREIAPDLLLALTWYWYRRGFVSEGRAWSERVLTALARQERTEARVKALISGASMAMWQGDLNAALPYIEDAVNVARWLEDPYILANVLMIAGVIDVNRGSDAHARTYLLESLDLFRLLNIDFFVAVSLVHLANASLGLADFEGASQRLDEAMVLSRVVGDAWLNSFALNNRGEVARAQSQYEEARAYYVESERLLREAGDAGDLARLVHTLGYIAQHEGDIEQAEENFRESLAMFLKVGNQRGIAECLAGLAGLQAEYGNPQKAATLLAAATSIQDATGAAWWPADRVEVERNTAVIRAALDEKTYAAAQKNGRMMSLDQAVAFALTAG